VTDARLGLVDLAWRGPAADAMAADLRAVLGDGRYLLGERTEALEAALADAIGVTEVVTLGSGTDALIGGLAALGIGPGDEVVAPAFGAFPTAAAIVAVGATPVLVDVEPSRPTLSLDAALAARTARTRAVIVVHLYGVVVDLAPWREALAGTGVHLIEDVAQAQGGSHRDGRAAGAGPGTTFGALSFYPTKNLGALGDGGAIATDDVELALALRRWRHHGIEGEAHVVASRNSRLDELQAAWLLRRLPELGAEVARRRALAHRYLEELGDVVGVVDHGAHGAPHLAVVRVDDPEGLRRQLDVAGIDTGRHYPLALPQQAPLRGTAPRPVPHAEEWARSVVSLPLHQRLADADQDRVIGAVRAARPSPPALT
jgi:dTDP-4-amino-4,6-dideoxygalactose transaminase